MNIDTNPPKDSSAFLSDRERRPADLPKTTDLAPLGLLLGNGSPALEVVLYLATQRPRRDDIRKVWKDRWNNRATPVLVVALYDGHASLCGHSPVDREPPPAGVALMRFVHQGSPRPVGNRKQTKCWLGVSVIADYREVIFSQATHRPQTEIGDIICNGVAPRDRTGLGRP